MRRIPRRLRSALISGALLSMGCSTGIQEGTSSTGAQVTVTGPTEVRGTANGSTDETSAAVLAGYTLTANVLNTATTIGLEAQVAPLSPSTPPDPTQGSHTLRLVGRIAARHALPVRAAVSDWNPDGSLAILVALSGCSWDTEGIGARNPVCENLLIQDWSTANSLYSGEVAITPVDVRPSATYVGVVSFLIGDPEQPPLERAIVDVELRYGPA